MTNEKKLQPKRKKIPRAAATYRAARRAEARAWAKESGLPFRLAFSHLRLDSHYQPIGRG